MPSRSFQNLLAVGVVASAPPCNSTPQDLDAILSDFAAVNKQAMRLETLNQLVEAAGEPPPVLANQAQVVYVHVVLQHRSAAAQL